MKKSEIQTTIFNKLFSILTENPQNWKKMWESFASGFHNPISGTYYSGGNVAACWINQQQHGFTSPNFITFYAAKQLAAKQIEGYEMKQYGKKNVLVWEGKGERPLIIDKNDLKEKGCQIYFWKFIKTSETDENGNVKEKTFPILKVSTVYNVELFKNIEIKVPENNNIKEKEFEIDQDKVNFFLGMENGPNFQEHISFNPCYNRVTDTVKMPKVGQFDGFAEYLSALSHEYTHAIGHESRLNRSSLMNSKGMGDTSDYPKDELVAEIAATMFAAYFGTLEQIEENSKAYLASWIRRLNDFDENGKKHFIWAIDQAHKAFNYIVDNQPTNELTAA